MSLSHRKPNATIKKQESLEKKRKKNYEAVKKCREKKMQEQQRRQEELDELKKTFEDLQHKTADMMDKINGQSFCTCDSDGCSYLQQNYDIQKTGEQERYHSSLYLHPQSARQQDCYHLDLPIVSGLKVLKNTVTIEVNIQLNKVSMDKNIITPNNTVIKHLVAITSTDDLLSRDSSTTK
ncbi:hypothetical protein FO519_008420 [Halicephalobus sp. NKZ332]|nr:hypothetical protein FO519_008420 [Halicephalobus sp. NKZ332]